MNFKRLIEIANETESFVGELKENFERKAGWLERFRGWIQLTIDLFDSENDD